jgi:RNA polymerase sigma-70 factor, ECF subfamily
MTNKSDSKIIEEFLGGNEQAFAHLIERYQEKVFRYAYASLGDYDDAEDVVQEVFIIVMESLHKFRGESKFSTWLYSVTANHCKNKKKKRRRFQNISLVRSKEEGEIAIPDKRQNVEKNAILDDSLQIVKDEISQLPGDYKEVLILRDIEELTYDEIASTLNITLSNVKVRIHRGREMLKRRLSHRGLL